MKKKGSVSRTTGSLTTVRGDDGVAVECRIRGRLRLCGSRSTSPVVVGDRVEYEIEPDGQGIISEILPRRNYVIRRSPNLSRESHIIAANLDQAVLLATLFTPTTSYEFADRFLVTCEAYHIPATVVLGKADLTRTASEAMEEFIGTYRSAGYPVLTLSALTGEGLEELRAMLAGKATLISGNSGVGKSTLIKALCPGAEVTVADVSQAHGKGRHTTTFSTVYELPGGGTIIDTPGIKGFGLLEIEPEELYQYFPEMLRVGEGCQYYNCTHVHEPGCAVIAAVERGEISYNRYESYLKILQEDDKYRK
ncbi:MAG: ribosome small subunit-dependent GTPase A [Rikenellaceae bacterium]|nr:ribosome small subunit-dependent GTPase A [Rikenellaceae bacterium]